MNASSAGSGSETSKRNATLLRTMKAMVKNGNVRDGITSRSGIMRAIVHILTALMKCRECGTEIAEKALICFRCGASVEEAVTKPYAARKSGGRPLSTLPLHSLS